MKNKCNLLVVGTIDEIQNKPLAVLINYSLRREHCYSPTYSVNVHPSSGCNCNLYCESCCKSKKKKDIPKAHQHTKLLSKISWL